MKNWTVTLPIAGHIVVNVQADNEDEAIEKALENGTLDEIESWEALKQFNRGNVCYCPRPWEAEAESDEDESDEEPQ